MAATFRGSTITIDGHSQVRQPPLSKCGFNQKGVSASADGITTTLSGDQWAPLNVIADGNNIGDYRPDGPVIHGLGDGAYWDPGRDTVVVLVSRNVFEVVDDVRPTSTSTLTWAPHASRPRLPSPSRSSATCSQPPSDPAMRRRPRGQRLT